MFCQSVNHNQKLTIMKTYNTPFGPEVITRKFIFMATQHSLNENQTNSFMHGNEPSEEARIKRAIYQLYPIVKWDHRTGDTTYDLGAAFETVCKMVDEATDIIHLERMAANLNGQPY